MKNKKPTVTVGIPVYNEEANIGKLLESILAQKEEGFVLEKIIIVCDASTDKTYRIVESFKDARIRHLRNPKRQGQQFSQNIILQNSVSDITVILEGDVLPASRYTLATLIKPLLHKNSKVGMTTGRSTAVTAKGFYEKILNVGHEFRSQLFAEWKGGVNVYTACGHSMKAISRQFAKVLIWPKHVPEDTFTYFMLRQEGFDMVSVPSAVAYMRNPTNFKDRLKQVNKFQNGKKALESYFTSEIVKREYRLPLGFAISYTAKSFIKNPFWLALYIVEVAVNRIFTYGRMEFNALYNPYNSTKALNTK